MVENPESKSIDLDQLRHHLSNAIGALQTAIRDIHDVTKGAEEAFELHDEGMARLRQALAMIDGAQSLQSNT